MASPSESPVLDPDVLTETDEDLEKPWLVVVYNDPVNLMSFVTYVFRKVFGYSDERARELMLEVHEKGRSVVWKGEREKSEFYVHQLQSHQLLAAMKKS
ncbi:MAG: ATP-dependent Clp protease adapter ClpS [Verrucomicrobiota bacterium]